MKGSEHDQLKQLIERERHNALVRHAGTVTMAALGLIGFGVMMVPIFGSIHISSFALLTEKPATAPVVPNSYANVSIIGQSAIVYDLSTGETLFEKDSSVQRPLASLTKLLTTYAATTVLEPNTPVTVSAAAIAQEGDSGLTAGETFAFKDLARFALVASSNDAAAAIADTAAARRSMSDKNLLSSVAAAVGLTQTYANNGTGLDETTKVSGGYGSAHDVAILAGAFLAKAPFIARATIEPSVSVSDTHGVTHTLPNTNQDIGKVPNPLLSKTGFTDLAGGNLVVVFDAGLNHPIAVVVLGSTRDGRFTDVAQLVSKTLDHFAVTPTSP